MREIASLPTVARNDTVATLKGETTLLEDWNVSERIEGLIATLKSTEHPSASSFFRKAPTLDSHVQSATRIDMCGVTLASTLSKQLSNLRDQLLQGAEIRLLVVDSESDAPTMATLRSEMSNMEYYHKRLAVTSDHLDYLFEHWQSTQENTDVQKGHLAVRFLPYAPSFGILGFDTERSTGKVFVEIYPHRTGFGSPPAFDLTPQKDGEWYTYFVNQFEAMWKAAKPWPPTAEVVQERPPLRRDKEPILRETFEEPTDWKNYEKGHVSRSTEVSHTGVFSLKKDGDGDPNGGFREIGRTIGRGFAFSGWIYRPDKRTRCNADRLSVEDESFNGYGFSVGHYADVIQIERREEGKPQRLGSQLSFSPPRDEWYQFRFYARTNGELELRLYDHSGKELQRVTDVSDEKYNVFDRIAVRGGFPFILTTLS
jgi:hypothetical protein